MKYIFFTFFCMFGFFVNSSSETDNEKRAKNKLDKHSPVIAVTQIAPHPSLDKIRDGALEAIRNAGFSPKAHISNAQGNFPTAIQIAQQIKGLKPDLVIAISTPSAQTIKRSGIEAPLIFAGVTSPMQAKLEPSESFLNISGTSTAPP